MKRNENASAISCFPSRTRFPFGYADPTDSKRIKRTYFLTPEAIAALTNEQTKRLLASCKQPELSDLVSEAIIAHYKQ